MKYLSCETCQYYLPEFRNRKLKGKLNRQIIVHLRKCEECLQKAEQVDTDFTHRPITSPQIEPAPVTKWGQAMTKWGGVFLLLLFVGALACFAYDQATARQVKADAQAWIRLRYPAWQLGTKQMDWTGWLPYYRHTQHFAIQPRWDRDFLRQLGTVVVERQGWHSSIQFISRQTTALPFVLPNMPVHEERSDTWRSLEQLPQSVSVQLAFSTRHALTPEALLKMLDRYECDLLWMPVYGGESERDMAHIPPLGLIMWERGKGPITPEQSYLRLQRDLETVRDSQSLPRRTFEQLWQERKSYLNQHGVKTYGALVRGTPRTLLQLKGVLELRSPTVINVDWALTN